MVDFLSRCHSFLMAVSQVGTLCCKINLYNKLVNLDSNKFTLHRSLEKAAFCDQFQHFFFKCIILSVVWYLIFIELTVHCLLVYGDF